MAVNIKGKEYPVVCILRTDKYGDVPLLEVKWMSDERHREIVKEQQKKPGYWEALEDMVERGIFSAEQLAEWKARS